MSVARNNQINSSQRRQGQHRRVVAEQDSHFFGPDAEQRQPHVVFVVAHIIDACDDQADTVAVQSYVTVAEHNDAFLFQGSRYSVGSDTIIMVSQDGKNTQASP
jgi:hypothetical protein